MIDSDKLLILVDSAVQMKAPTPESRIHYYTFFTNYSGTYFNYFFQIHQDLHSTKLHEDLAILREGHYLDSGSDFYVTEKGQSWIKRLPSDECEAIRKPINRVLRQYRDADNLTLFRDAYVIITRGIRRPE